MPVLEIAAPSNNAAVLEQPLPEIMAANDAPAVPAPERTTLKALSRDSIWIYQIYFQPQQRPLLDPAFEPFNNAGNNSPLREFDVFLKLAESPAMQQASLWGALSWKFGQKTGSTGEAFRKEIESHPGYDVYFVNPHPETEALYHNLWQQGETSHPNFLALCKAFFRAADLPENILTEVQPSGSFASANYFVATPAFWRSYIPFVRNALARAELNLSPEMRGLLYSSAADHKGAHAGASYVPFIVERLFAVFLASDEGSAFRAYKIAPVVDVNVHIKLLSEMKDVAHRTKSLWLAACWVNYRNLYLANAYGTDWVRRYLKDVTPAALRFGTGGANVTVGAKAQ
jgi:hypothetical protein